MFHDEVVHNRGAEPYEYLWHDGETCREISFAWVLIPHKLRQLLGQVTDHREAAEQDSHD